MGMVRNAVTESGEEQVVRIVEWNRQDHHQQQMHNNHHNGGFCGGADGGLYGKVMTDEQMELLRRQISVYATICEQLVEMHKTITAQQDLAGVRLGSLYCDPLTSAGHKIVARQRWMPTRVQLQILERIFDQGNGTPSKQKIKDITTELSQHGQISETNVYNWLQNRRARSKQKQLVAVPSNDEPEFEAEVETSKDKKTKPESSKSLENTTPKAENVYSKDPKTIPEMHYPDIQNNEGDPMYPSHYDLSSTGSLDHLAFYDSIPRIEHLMSILEVPRCFGP